MSTVHEAIFRTKGYQHVHPKQDLYRYGKRLEASTIVYTHADFWAKDAENPEVGRIRLVLNPVNVGTDQTMAVLLGQLEGIVTSAAPKPYRFSGERSPLYQLEQPCFVASPSGILHRAEGLQMKGFLYRPIHTGKRQFSPLTPYRGDGAPLEVFSFDEEGNFQVFPPKIKLSGVMTFPEMVFESLYARLLSNKTKRVSPSFGYAEFLDRPYISEKETLRTGFAIHFMDRFDRLRGPDFIAKVLSNVKDPVQQSRIISLMYETMAEGLSEIHGEAVALQHPHFENFSFRFDKKDPLGAVSRDTKVHDFNNAVWMRDVGFPAFLGYTLMDFVCVAIQHDPDVEFATALQQHPEIIEIEVQSTASDLQIPIEEARAILDKSARTICLLNSAAGLEAAPMTSFLRAYFKGQAVEMAKQPEGFINAVGQDLGSLLMLYLYKTSKGNPFNGIYNCPSPLSLAATKPGQVFVPLLLNRKLRSADPNELINYTRKEVEFPPLPKKPGGLSALVGKLLRRG